MLADDERQAEIEALAEAIRDTYVELGTRSGLFGSVGLLSERSRRRLAEVLLDRVRDARGDDERWREAGDALADALRGLDSYAASSQTAPLERSERAQRALERWDGAA